MPKTLKNRKRRIRRKIQKAKKASEVIVKDVRPSAEDQMRSSALFGQLKFLQNMQNQGINPMASLGMMANVNPQNTNLALSNIRNEALKYYQEIPKQVEQNVGQTIKEQLDPLRFEMEEIKSLASRAGSLAGGSQYRYPLSPMMERFAKEPITHFEAPSEGSSDAYEEAGKPLEVVPEEPVEEGAQSAPAQSAPAQSAPAQPAPKAQPAKELKFLDPADEEEELAPRKRKTTKEKREATKAKRGATDKDVNTYLNSLSGGRRKTVEENAKDAKNEKSFYMSVMREMAGNKDLADVNFSDLARRVRAKLSQEGARPVKTAKGKSAFDG